MRTTIQRFRWATALSMALWMAALACVTGCMLPALASPKPIACPEELAANRATEPAEAGLIADVPNCPHAAHHAPAKPQPGKHAPTGTTSCCFLEMNAPAKVHAPQPQLAVAHAAIPVAMFDVTPAWTHAALELSPPVDRAGRDTLLQTHLLRI